MIIIVGLGNPTERYDRTRHNAGFDFVEAVRLRFVKVLNDKKLVWKENKKLKSKVCKIKAVGEEFVLVQPQTYMNRSGEAVSKVVNWYHLKDLENLVLAHDDLDLELGKFKVQFAKAPKEHNGVTSVEDSLKNRQFWRVRLGVDNRREVDYEGEGEDFVLEPMGDNEYERMKKGIEEAVSGLIDALVTGGLI